MHKIIEECFEKYADKYFIDTYSFHDVFKLIKEKLVELKEQGIKAKDRVIIQHWNNIDFVIEYFAIIYLGAIAVTVSPLLTEQEIKQIKEHCNQEHKFPIIKKLEDKVVVVIYTSGTTGNPKGVVLTKKNILAQVDSAGKALEITQTDSFLGILSFAHVFGQMDVLWMSLINGCQIFPVERFNSEIAVERLITTNPSILIAVPTMYRAILNYLNNKLGKLKFENLRVCHSGATPLSKSLYQELKEYFKVPIQEGYGLTESCSMAFSNPLRGNQQKPGSVGKAIDGVEVKIEQLNGKIGEVLIKGKIITPGYYNEQKITEETINKEGWLRTGDLGYLDKDKYLFLVDRKKDLIIRGGYKLYPREIEECLLQHKLIDSVAVLSIEENESRIIAFITVKTNSTGTLVSELKALCKKNLAKYKHPNKYILVDELPKTSSGKIKKRELKSNYLNLLVE